MSAAILSPASLGLPFGRPRRPTALERAAGVTRARLCSAIGSLRRLPTRARAAIRATLRLHADRPGLPPPAQLASRICRPCFMPDRPWAPTLQRFLPARRRMTLSDHAVLHAVPHLAVPRLRGFQPSFGCVLRAPALFTPSLGRSSPGCSPPSRMASRPRPTLLRGSSLGLSRVCAPSAPLAVRLRPTHTCALQSFRDPEV
jgi:hypothetical protein